MPFSKIIGHQKQLEYLKRLIENRRFSHAYLFSGPKSLGKATIAKTLLEAITNTRLEQNPNAMLVGDGNRESGIGNSVKTISRTPNPEHRTPHVITVEEIRDLRGRMALSGLVPGKKVALIDDAEQMTLSAQNALLKTLEEPRGETIIILVSHQPDQLLETIRSRCTEIRFHPVDGQKFGGRPGLAITLQDPDAQSDHDQRQQQAQLFLDSPLWKRITMIEQWGKEKQELPMMQWEVLLHERLAQDLRTSPLCAFVQLQHDLAHNSNKQLALQEFAKNV